jgi:Ca-activated chloride channel family protein
MKLLSSSVLASLIPILVACGGAEAEPRVATEFEPTAVEPNHPDDIRGGDLRVVDDDLGIQSFPLKHTDVQAEIVGNVARVEITQTFQNPYDKKIEAVYVFPLPNRAAVDDMTIQVGERTIKGIIKKRDEARRIYEAARKAGHVAALLDQERPNIFTQSVANILPGNEIEVKIRYFEALPYESAAYQFSFPMVVGPRFIPGTPTSSENRGWAPNTTDVPDASRITPPVLKPGQRSGHDISVKVTLDAGTGLQQLLSPSHQVDIKRKGRGRALVTLRHEDSIPNKDFVLRYRVDGNAPKLVLLPHRSTEDGYFLMLIQPEAKPADEKITPKEMIFVVDGSGSMSGFPMEKVKEAMRHSLQNLNPQDTFQVVRFSNRAETFAPEPVSATRENIQRGLGYVESLSGRGGTIMLEGVRTALSYPDDPERLRIISFMTDGYIGNENQILAHLEKHLGGARLFSFGVGSSVNRFLLDKMAEFGRGAVEYVLLQDDAEVPVKRFYERIRNPYLTDIEIDWSGLEVTDVYPKRIPDLFLGQPVVLHGRYVEPGNGSVTLKARLGGKPYQQKIEVHLPNREEQGGAIGTLWARARIEELSNQQIVDPQPELVEEITKVALAHRLVSAYTSFVAVEEQIVTGSDQPVLVEVPVEMPEGVSYEGVFGREQKAKHAYRGAVGGKMAALPSARPAQSRLLAEEASNGPHRSPVSIQPLPGEVEAEPRKERDRLGRPDMPDSDDKQGAVSCRIETARRSYRIGEAIEIVVTIENLTSQTMEVPAALSVVDGTARFQILDTNWKAMAHPTRPAAPRTLSLAPGARITFRVLLNGTGGYQLSQPGTYHLVLLGMAVNLPNSNTLTLHIAR